LLSATSAAIAQELGQGPLPLTVMPQQPIHLETTDSLIVEGVVDGGDAQLVVRLDDGQSTNYMNRYNAERTLPAGPFSLSLPAGQMRTPSGRPLDLADIRKIIIGSFGGSATVSVSRFEISHQAAGAQAGLATNNSRPVFPTGPAPIDFIVDPPLRLNPSDSLTIKGVIDGGGAGLVVRVEDDKSAGYDSRFNLETELPAGPFTVTVPASDMRTPSGRPVDLGDIRRIVIGPYAGSGKVFVKEFDLAGNSIAPTSEASTVEQTTAQAPAPASSAPAAETSGNLSLGSGPLPIEYTPGGPVRLSSSDVIAVEGSVTGGPMGVVLRVDDANSVDYSSRYNSEQSLQPGPFLLSVRADALTTPKGRPLELGDIRRIVFGAIDGVGTATVSRFEIRRLAAAASPQDGTPSQGKTMDLGRGVLPIKFEPAAPVAREEGDEVRIDGEVPPGASATIVLRIDDSRSNSYATRFNDERTLPPGPFHWMVGLKGLRTSGGGTLNFRAISRIILFVPNGDPGVAIGRFEIAPAMRLPQGAMGYSLGARDAPVPAGFERIAPGDPRLTGSALAAVKRPAPDPLVANGVKGIGRLTLRAPPGHDRVTIWSEDPGEWELLPFALRRRITVNGVTALSYDLKAQDWIRERYMAGRAGEHTESDDAWTAYGIKRGQERSVEVDVAGNGVVIECDGDSPDAKFISAVLVEPANQHTGHNFVEAQRANWYRNTYPVTSDKSDADPAVPLRLSWTEGRIVGPVPVTMVAAPDTGARVRLAIRSEVKLDHPDIRLVKPVLGAMALPMMAWSSVRRLEREGNLLVLRGNRLAAELADYPIGPSVDRALEIWVSVAENARPGVYRGSIDFAADGRTLSVPVEVRVPPVSLPLATKPAGFYLAAPPHLAYFPGLALDKERQSDCDLSFLHQLGLTGTAPATLPPEAGNLTGFLSDMQRASRLGVSPGWLIYNPALSVLLDNGVDKGASILAAADSAMRKQGISAVWSIADEPSNPDSSSSQLVGWIKALRDHAPGIKLAGQFNSPTDDRFVGLVDTAIINEGYGLDAGTIDRLVQLGHDVWIYNTTHYPRLTAGLWLWHTTAKRYVQWHARMPTADPFDPLDGREADYQMFIPGLRACDPQPDIHADLLRMAEGVVDQRWLLWLESQTGNEAKDLLASIKSRLGTSWKGATRLSSRDVQSIRDSIMALSTAGG
jgi:hypothetical protein